jgi:ABC-type glucose/galactose transport system permease subunit
VILIVWVVLEQTTYGRRLYAIGGNAEAARLAGLPVPWLRLTAFAFTGDRRGGRGADVRKPRRLRQPYARATG